jgi:phosphatidylglycerophosphatase A
LIVEKIVNYFQASSGKYPFFSEGLTFFFFTLQAPPSKMNAIQNLRNTMWKLIEKKDLEAIQVSHICLIVCLKQWFVVNSV